MRSAGMSLASAVFRWAADVYIAIWEERGLPRGLVVPRGLIAHRRVAGGIEGLGVGNTASQETPATPPDTAQATRPAREALFSVLRTGTDDLRIASGADILTASLKRAEAGFGGPLWQGATCRQKD